MAVLTWDCAQKSREETNEMIFIAYIGRSSIGGHLLNIGVTLPALALIY